MSEKKRSNMSPAQRTKMYGSQLRKNKNGELPNPLSPTAGAYRSGYIQKAGDDAQIYKYKAAIAAGYSAADAKLIASKRGPEELKGITSELVFKRNGKKLNGKQ